MSLTSKSNRNAQKYRIVFLGDQGVGKTSIIEKYTTDRFDECHNSTVGIDFNVKDVKKDGNLYRLQMWDTAGQQRYRSLIPTYLKNAHCVVLVYDITKSKSLENLNLWHKMFTQNQQAPGIVIGNKSDLMNGRKVNKTDAQQFCKKINLRHMEVSAKTGKKINQLFDIVLEIIIKAQEDDFLEPNTTRQKFGNREKQKQKQKQKRQKVRLQKSKKSWKQKLQDKCCSQG